MRIEYIDYVLIFCISLAVVFACEPLTPRFNESLAAEYAPLLQLHTGEQYTLEQVYYQIHDVQNKTIIQYWYQWNYSKAFWYENAFGAVCFGKKFDHPFDFEPVFVTITNGEIEKIEYDAKHYVRGTSIQPLMNGTHPLLQVIKNSHGFRPGGKGVSSYEQYGLLRLSDEKKNEVTQIIAQLPYALNITPILSNPMCFSQVTSGPWKTINKWYGDKSGNTFSKN